MFVMMSNHAGELLTRLVGAYKWVLIACTADGPDSGWGCRSDHMPQYPGHPLFFKRALRIPRRHGIAVENLSLRLLDMYGRLHLFLCP